MVIHYTVLLQTGGAGVALSVQVQMHGARRLNSSEGHWQDSIDLIHSIDSNEGRARPGWPTEHQ